MSYILNPSIPSVTNVGTVSLGVAGPPNGAACMWKDGSDVVHFICTFGTSPYYLHYINTATGTHVVVTDAGALGDSRYYAYHPTYDKLYISGKYQGVLAEFDPSTQTLTILQNSGEAQSTQGPVIGDDGLVYWISGNSHVWSYNPATQTMKDYGKPVVGNNEFGSIGAFGGYVYAGLLKDDTSYTLCITSTTGTPSWSAWEFDGLGDTSVTVSRSHTGNYWQARRRLANDTWKYYDLSAGGYSETTEREQYYNGEAPLNCLFTGDEANYNLFYGLYNWDVDLGGLLPIKDIHEFSRVGLSQTQGVFNSAEYPTGNYYEAAFTGDWLAQYITAIVPLAAPAKTVLAITSGYMATIDLEYTTPTPDYLGANCHSPYFAMRHSSGEIYVCGYSGRCYRYNPAAPWTLNNANAGPTTPDDESKPNPYIMDMGATMIHYYRCMDYDANGKVWIGGNTTRLSPNYGQVTCYTPSDGSLVDKFSWSGAGTHFINLCACLNRTKILVSNSIDQIFVIDAATGNVDATPINPYGSNSCSWMIEVSYDRVIVVTLSGNATSGGTGTYRIGLLQPSDKSWVISPQALGDGVSGIPFGSPTAEDIMNKLELGPDDYVWMFVGSKLYRINPTTCKFNEVLTADNYYKIKFAADNKDLLLYGNGTDFKYYAGMLTELPHHGIYGVENVKPYGANAGKIYGVG